MITQVPRQVLQSLRASPVFAFYVLATLAVAAIVAMITVGIIDLGMEHFGDLGHRTHDVAYGLLFTTLVVGMLAQLRRPEENVAAMAMALVPPGGLLLASVLADDPGIVDFNPLHWAAWITVVAALVHPAGRNVLRSFRRSRVDGTMLALIGLAAVPLLRFASTNIGYERAVSDVHAAMGHYGFMAALSYTVVAIGVLASLRPAGWRLTAWVAGSLPALLGATSLIYPDATSSLDPDWALAAIAWGVMFVAVAARARGASADGRDHERLHGPVDARTSARCGPAGARSMAHTLRVRGRRQRLLGPPGPGTRR